MNIIPRDKTLLGRLDGSMRNISCPTIRSKAKEQDLFSSFLCLSWDVRNIFPVQRLISSIGFLIANTLIVREKRSHQWSLTNHWKDYDIAYKLWEFRNTCCWPTLHCLGYLSWIREIEWRICNQKTKDREQERYQNRRRDQWSVPWNQAAVQNLMLLTFPSLVCLGFHWSSTISSELISIS